jgi:hypothetical protein
MTDPDPLWHPRGLSMFDVGRLSQMDDQEVVPRVAKVLGNHLMAAAGGCHKGLCQVHHVWGGPHPVTPPPPPFTSLTTRMQAYPFAHPRSLGTHKAQRDKGIWKDRMRGQGRKDKDEQIRGLCKERIGGQGRLPRMFPCCHQCCRLLCFQCKGTVYAVSTRWMWNGLSVCGKPVPEMRSTQNPR